MRLKPDQLPAHLQKNLAPIYFVSGDEPLLVNEAADAIRAAARRVGCSERLVYTLESGFDWNQLREAQNSLSLFAERRLLELRMASPKPGDAGGQALRDYAARPPEGDVLLITAGKLEKETQNAKWFQALEQSGIVVQVWPVEPAQLPRWIAQRMATRGLKATPEAVALLAERVQGNLLACTQEIEKLLLLHGEGVVDADAVTEAVADSARYDVFVLVDAALAGDAPRAARILRGLRGEGEEPVLILWALTREIRALLPMLHQLRQGEALDRVLAAGRVWDKRKAPVQAALKRLTPARCHELLILAGEVDRAIKGARRGNVWDELLQLTLGLAGLAVSAGDRLRA